MKLFVYLILALVFWENAVLAESTKEKVQKYVNENNIMVFSKSYCPYCAKVKKLFGELKLNFKVLELDQQAEGSEIQGVLLEMTGQRTVPSVWIHQKHIGGSDATLQLHQSGKLMELINGSDPISKQDL